MTRKSYVLAGTTALALVLLALGWSSFVFADSPDATVIVVPNVTEAQPGDEITVTVSYAQITDTKTIGHQTLLQYNPQVLQFKDAQLCAVDAECFWDASPALPSINSATLGEIRAMQMGLGSGVGTSRTGGLMLTVHMTVTGMGSSDFVVPTGSPNTYFIPEGGIGDSYPPHILDITQVMVKPEVYFESSTYDVDEDAGSAIITATIEASSTLPITITLATVAGGSATPGSDYTSRTEQIVFGVGLTQTTFTPHHRRRRD